MGKCLFCYKDLKEGQRDFHPECAKKFFGTKDVPVLDYKLEDLDELAAQIIQAQTSLTGVQPKLSLNLDKHEGSCRLTIVGLWGNYIFKPQTKQFGQLPENEDLTMHLAEIVKIRTVPHTLIRMADGSLGYITTRIDRTMDGQKIDMEDMCQLTLHPTEYKYNGSYEQVAKNIVKYCNMPKLDLVNYMQLLLFCFITGNNDMHLKNFSLYSPKDSYQLTPAYDLLNVSIANPKDKEELALTLNGRKSNIRLSDFMQSAETMGIEEKVMFRLIEQMQKAVPQWMKLIERSFLSSENQERYKTLITERLERLKS
jgi:serine/threonine-protein kinase HipA